METKARILAVQLPFAVTILALMTFVGFSANASINPHAVNQAPLSRDGNFRREVNLSIKQGQALANAVFSQIQTSGEVASYEVAGPRDRWEHMCAEDCVCLAKHFRKEFKRYGFDVKTVSINKAQNSTGIKIAGARSDYGIISSPSWDHHAITIVRFVGGWRVIDPLTLPGAQLEPFKSWKRKIKSPVLMSVR